MLDIMGVAEGFVEKLLNKYRDDNFRFSRHLEFINPRTKRREYYESDDRITQLFHYEDLNQLHIDSQILMNLRINEALIKTVREYGDGIIFVIAHPNRFILKIKHTHKITDREYRIEFFIYRKVGDLDEMDYF